MHEGLAVPLAALVLGFTGSVHCLGMCGGIAASLSFAVPESRRRSGLALTGWQTLYAAGRITSYTLFGAIAGALGGFVSLKLPFMVPALLSGVLLVLAGLYLAGWSRLLLGIETLGKKLWQRIQPMTRRFLPVDRPSRAFALGFLWGWLPCGLVYTALALALTAGSVQSGALSMLLFGLGTLPAVVSAGVVAGRFQSFTRRPLVRRLAGLLVIGLGIGVVVYAFSMPMKHGGMAGMKMPMPAPTAPSSR